MPTQPTCLSSLRPTPGEHWSSAESKFKGLGWLAYDKQFHCYAASNLTRLWDLIDLELWTVTFSGLAKLHCFVCSSPYHSHADCRKADPTHCQNRGPGSCCFSFNKPSGCNRCSCQFPHVCSPCRSPSHAFPNCTSNSPSRTSPPRTPAIMARNNVLLSCRQCPKVSLQLVVPFYSHAMGSSLSCQPLSGVPPNYAKCVCVLY